MFLGVGTKLARDQRNALAHVHPIPAIVVSLDVEEHRINGKGGIAYRPVVRFQYQLDGTTRMGDQVGPLPESRAGHWAWRVLQRYQVGQHVTAWVRNDVVDQAYLERTPSLRPYGLMGFGAVFTVVFGWLWMRHTRNRSEQSTALR